MFKNTGRLCPTLTLTDLSPRRVGILINRGRAGTDFVCEPANFAFVSAGAEMAKLCNIPPWRWLFAQTGRGGMSTRGNIVLFSPADEIDFRRASQTGDVRRGG